MGVGRCSRKDLEVDCFLELTGVFDEFDDLLLALRVGSHLSNVLSKHVAAVASKEAPQVLDKRLAEENQSLLAAIFKVNVEVVLPDVLAMLSKFVHNFRD